MWRQKLDEIGIKELKRLHQRSQHEANSPFYVWDHSLQLQAAIRLHTVHGIYDLQGGSANYSSWQSEQLEQQAGHADC